MKILSTAPTRISLFGGGTDIDPYASTFGGVCINLAINLRQQVNMYSGEELFELHGKSVFPVGANPDFYYQILDEFNINDGIHLTKLVSTFDGLIESGIGSSASAAVALVGAVNRRLNLRMDRYQIAEKAWELEVNKLGLYGGKQDQYAAAFGGMNILHFNKGQGVEVIPIDRKSVELLLPSMVLFYTGSNRKSAKIQEGFKKLTRDQVWALDRIRKLAQEAIKPVMKGDYVKVGALLDEAWEFKKLSNRGVSNTRIDNLIKVGKLNGAYGGKIMGAGGGGYMIFIVKPSERESFIKEIVSSGSGLEWWDFSPDFNGLEVRIL